MNKCNFMEKRGHVEYDACRLKGGDVLLGSCDHGKCIFQQILCVRVLTEDEAFDLFTMPDESDEEKPQYVDDNIDEWLGWMYKKGYRIGQEMRK